MAMSRRMTDSEMEYFLKQVERKGKALSLPADQLDRYRGEYNKINEYLKEHYRSFICSKIIRRNRYIDLDVFNRFVAEEEYGLFALANQALDDGSAGDLACYVWMMHLKYMVMWRISMGKSTNTSMSKSMNTQIKEKDNA